MSDDQAQRFFEFLLSEDAETIDCASVLEAIHRYVDLEVAGRPADVLMPGVAAHLAGCDSCQDVVATLSEVARRESEGTLPRQSELWSEMAKLAEPAGRAAAGRAIAGQTSPSRVAPAPSRAELDAALGRSSDKAADPKSGSKMATWGLAVAACAVLLLGAGWWRSATGADRTEDVLKVTGSASEVSETHSSAGAWAKVFFEPDDDEASVLLGDVPALKVGQRLECWLKKRAGGAEKLAAFAQIDPNTNWWVIDADQPMKDYAAMIVKVANASTSEALMEVPLTETR